MYVFLLLFTYHCFIYIYIYIHTEIQHSLKSDNIPKTESGQSYCTLVLLFLHTFMCSHGEGPRRTETSHLLTKSLELKCHAHIF